MAKDTDDYEMKAFNYEEKAEGRLDTDLAGMDKTAAGEYVLAFATTLKETEKACATCEQELALWQQRLELAKSKNEEALALQAQAKVAELAAKRDSLLAEKGELRRKVTFMKDELKRLKSQTELSLDAEALLEQLKMIAGEPDNTSQDIAKLKVEEELARLKEKLKAEGDL